MPCESPSVPTPGRIRDVAVTFTGDAGATITRSAPAAAGQGVRCGG